MKNYKIFLLVYLIICLFSCNHKKSETIIDLTENLQEKRFHTWYYFSDNDFIQIEQINLLKEVPEKPWTDAKRISDSINTTNKSLFLINSMGIMIFSQEKTEPEIFIDNNVFKNKTAKRFTIENSIPVFLTYNDTLLSNSRDITNNETFLYQFEIDTGIVFPLLKNKIFDLTEDFQVKDFFKNNDKFYIALKKDLPEKSYFQYKTLTSNLPLTARNNTFQIENITQEEFNHNLQPENFEEISPRIKKLLNRLDTNQQLYLTVHYLNNGEKKFFHKENPNSSILKGEIILAQNYCLAVLQDGTCFFNGALPNNYILNQGETIAFKLPKLPSNFYYSNIASTKTKLYVGWEEKDFYKTKNTGFIEIKLEKLLYN